MKKANNTELVKAGQVAIVRALAREPVPLTRAVEKLLHSGAEIAQQAPDTIELAYLARELVHCTLPHRDPGDVPDMDAH